VRIEVAYGDTTGTIDLELYDDVAPKTVMNFLRYAGRGYYTSNGFFNDNFHNGFFHRSVPGFTIRAGGYGFYYNPLEVADAAIYEHVPQDPPIPNEFSLPNVRGTITMAKDVDNPGPDSATSEWIINLADNGGAPLNFDTLNGGYAVFGRVIAGMEHAVAIGDLPNSPAPIFPTKIDGSIVSGQFDGLPRINYDPNGAVGVQPENLVRLLRIPNVAGARVPAGGWAIFTADVDMTFDSSITGTVDPDISKILLTAFKSPPGMEVHFNNDMIVLSLSGPTGPAARVITMYDGATVRPTHYYAYGPTPDDPSQHWYDFAFDGMTGAEIKNDRIVLHFVDGERGDYDRTVNDKIDHTGAQAVVTPIASSQSGGCSITIMPSRATRGGEWALIAAFLIFLAIRRRVHRNQLQ
jgi:cyclophilin family peptidyl-prolyl cis-trans isomerase